MKKKYDLIVVGTGFGSSFFLKRFLERSPDSSKVLVLEKGRYDTSAWQRQNNKNSSINSNSAVINTNQNKEWIFNLCFGGGSNCWGGCTPRFMPNDFKMRTQYGVSEDWPISYEELERYYCEAEQIMNISGQQNTPFPMSQSYPLPPHNPSSVDKLLIAQSPDSYFIQPTARASRSTEKRGRCCANGICHLCPINAKFTILNDFQELYADPRVELKLESSVESLVTSAGLISGVIYQQNGEYFEDNADLVSLGANALFNPVILQNSNITDNSLGKYLNEQTALVATVDLADVDNFDGSSAITGHGYQFYDGAHRSEHAACVIESYNLLDSLRIENGKWRKRVVFKLIFEDIPQAHNYVTSDPSSKKPLINFKGFSDYSQRGKEAVIKPFENWLSKAINVEQFSYQNDIGSEAHIQGTTRMGNDPTQSCVDKTLKHHQYRNLIITGSSVFSSCPPANPSLSISALSLMAADKLFS